MPTVELNNAKVMKHFGAHPERGRLMKHFTTIKKHAGMKAQVKAIITPAGEMVGTREMPNPYDLRGEPVNYVWVRNPIQVWPVLALKNVGANRWEVFIQPEYLQQALRWLHDTCVFQAPPKKKRKRGYKKQDF